MRTALIIVFAANLVLVAVSHDMLPDRVATHFGTGGQADGWSSKNANTRLTIAMDAFIFCLLYYAPRWITVVPAKWLNLPNKEYWLTPANMERTRGKLASLMWRFGIAFFLLFFAIGMLTLQANLAEPPCLNETRFLVALTAFMLYTVYWTVAVVRDFRIPKDQSPRS